MSLKHHSGAVFYRHMSYVQRTVELIDRIRALKDERARLLSLQTKPWARIRALTDQIYSIENQDELDTGSCKAVSENDIGTCWTY